MVGRSVQLSWLLVLSYRRSRRKVFGTFSMYFKNPSQANDRDIQFASILTDTAAQLIGQRI